mgnify:CR=1 FL=1
MKASIIILLYLFSLLCTRDLLAMVRDTSSRDELNVYSTVLKHLRLGNSNFSFIDLTIAGHEIERQRQHIDSILVQAFIQQNELERQIPKKFIETQGLKISERSEKFEFVQRYAVLLYNQDLFAHLVKEDSLSWTCIKQQVLRTILPRFTKEDLGWSIQFSRVGFNTKQTQALVYFEVIDPIPNSRKQVSWCGNAELPAEMWAGTGDYAILVLENHQWHVKQFIKSWFMKKNNQRFSKFQ